MSVEEALGRMRLLLARRSVVARRLAAAADGPGEVRSPRLDGMPRGHGTRGGTLAVLGRMEALADECAEIEGELRALSARVEGPILALPPGPHRLVMRLRYLEWRAVSDVANGAGYERRYTYKLLEEGERRLAREESAIFYYEVLEKLHEDEAVKILCRQIQQEEQRHYKNITEIVNGIKRGEYSYD